MNVRNVTGTIQRASRQIHSQLTELFSPLRDSLNHLRKSCEGGTGKSSTRETATLAAVVGAGRAGVPLGRGAAAGAAAGATELFDA
jgi:hypothetical protein